MVYLFIAGLVGYICGAIPFGYLYVRIFKGADIRTVGSGRTGGTNSYRAAGFGVGLLTGISDILKGYIAVWFIQTIFQNTLNPNWLPWAIVSAGTMVVVGHNWSVFMGWRGGAGTTPNIGWASIVWLPIGPLGFGIMLFMLIVVGIASVASLTMAAIVPFIFSIRYILGIDPTPAYLIASIFTGLIIVWALRPNIKRLLTGNERVVGLRAKRRERQEEQRAISK